LASATLPTNSASGKSSKAFRGAPENLRNKASPSGPRASLSSSTRCPAANWQASTGLSGAARAGTSAHSSAMLAMVFTW
jgi:hypothetical protein